MFQQISIENAVKKAQETGGMLLDLRSMQEYQKGHLPGAYYVPSDQIEEKIENNRKCPVFILYCTYGGKSMKLAQMLDEKGYSVINTIGGFEQYHGILEVESHFL